MKIAILAQTSNECDIIELFVRINSRYADHLYFADMSSSDATPRILEKLREEGYPVTAWHYPVNFNTNEIRNDSFQRVAGQDGYDWIFLLDADEFLTGTRNDLETKLASLPPSHCASLLWRTYVPSSDQYFEIDNPLHA
ncbi:MAG: glycosyltransferase family 2 protein, partial [Verrucomicrobiota bacterium]